VTQVSDTSKNKILYLNRQLKIYEGRIKMSNQLNKNLIKLSKGYNTMGLKEQISQLEEKIREDQREHKRNTEQLTKK